MGRNARVGATRETQNRLRELSELRSKFSKLTTVEDAARAGARLAFEHIAVQLASVYIFDQEGMIRPLARVGRDEEGTDIDELWLGDERHLPGESFAGRAIIPAAHSSFGVPQWTNSLEKHSGISQTLRRAYSQKLGRLDSGVAVPLNGRSRSFGVLEVINKKAQRGESEIFSTEDVHWLSLIGNETATAISLVRRQGQLSILSSFAQKTATSHTDPKEETLAYYDVAKALTESHMPFRVCIIRFESEGILRLGAIGSSSVPTAARSEVPIPAGQSLAGKVFSESERLYIPDITAIKPDKYGLQNWQWAKDSGLIAYLCIPLVFEGYVLGMSEERVLGTMSIYFGYRHQVDQDEWEYLETLGSLIAAFRHSRQVLRDLAMLFDQDARDARLASYDSRRAPSRHDFRDFLRVLRDETLRLEGVNLGTERGSRLYQKLLSSIESKSQSLKKEFEEAGREAIDLNELIQEVIQQWRQKVVRPHIEFKFSPDRDLPLVRAYRPGLRFVIRDLVANAVKAIEATGSDYGEIGLQSAVRIIKDVEYFEIEVEDSGSGIPSENWDRIFDRGFTTYEGGSGMGLFLAQDVLYAYGGRVELVESTVGRGSTFRALIPSRHRQ